MARLATLILSLSMLTAHFAPAQAAKAEHCGDLIGTYLTKNFAKGGSHDNFTSRSLISLTEGGQAFFTDSGEGGEARFAPFTGARGAWRCISDETNPVSARATVLDFTFVAPGEPRAQIGRLDLEMSYDEETKTVHGTATLYLVPLTSDPLQPAELGEGRDFELTGERVEAP